ncbi:MAG TPA: hypothetical protein DDW23_01560 [Planctomycetes bacterium]|nr:hypothetical protein [Planctomycetota bacterium]
MSAGEVWLDEAFLSLQGEGRETGKVHLFLRLGGCPLRCRWCDTPRSWKRQSHWELHLKDETLEMLNPVGLADLKPLLDRVLESYGFKGFRPVLAVTGGEPLAQAPFLLSWLPMWPGPVMLETAGVSADTLAEVVPHVDQVSLDWKIPSALEKGAGLSNPAECLQETAKAGVATSVKLVVTEDESLEEWRCCLENLAAVAPGTCVWIQPVTPIRGGPLPPTGEKLLKASVAFSDLDIEIRVQGQMHPSLGIQ